VIGDGGILNSLAASFTLVLANSRLELAGDACGIAHVWVGLALNPALSARAATGWRPFVGSERSLGRTGFDWGNGLH
jgi:hypothetical protein